MANSVLTQIKVKDDRSTSPEEPTRAGTWEVKSQDSPRNAVTFTHTFESRDQAIAVCRILSHQVQLLQQQAQAENQSQLPYLSDILGDYSHILETMLEKIKTATNQ